MVSRGEAHFLQLKERSNFDRFKGFFTQFGPRQQARQEERTNAIEAILQNLNFGETDENKAQEARESSAAHWATGAGNRARQFHTALIKPPKDDGLDVFKRGRPDVDRLDVEQILNEPSERTASEASSSEAEPRLTQPLRGSSNSEQRVSVNQKKHNDFVYQALLRAHNMSHDSMGSDSSDEN
jgi:hypothetical protein